MNIQATIPIDPITKIKTIVYTQMEIKILHLAFPENTAEIQVIVYDAQKEYSKSFVYGLIGDDYSKWTDDSYLVQYVKGKLKTETF